jgi:hypothetical protein
MNFDYAVALAIIVAYAFITWYAYRMLGKRLKKNEGNP